MKKLTKKVLAALLVLTAICGIIPLAASAYTPKEELLQQLAALIAEAEAIEDIGYTAMSWSAFSSARSSAKRVLNETNPDVADITAQINSLQSTMDHLTLLAEKTGFEKFIDALLRPFYTILFFFALLFS